MKIKKSINLEVTLKELLDKHNLLAKMVNEQLIPAHNDLSTLTGGNIEQIFGQLQEISKSLDNVYAKLGNLETSMKLHAFHLNKVQVENTALRNCLLNLGIDLNTFKDEVDHLLSKEFLVNSDYVPVGSVQITEY